MLRAERVTEPCGTCGKAVTLPKSMMDRRKRGNATGKAYCSRACGTIAVHERLISPRATEPCGICGKEITNTAFSIEKRKRRSKSGKIFCSSVCSGVNSLASINHPKHPPQRKPEANVADLAAAIAAAIAPLLAAQAKK